MRLTPLGEQPSREGKSRAEVEQIVLVEILWQINPPYRTKPLMETFVACGSWSVTITTEQMSHPAQLDCQLPLPPLYLHLPKGLTEGKVCLS